MPRYFHVGTALLLIATALLIVASVSNPVTTDISLMKIELTNSSTIRRSSILAGVFGTCILDGAVAPGTRPDQDFCSEKSVGYPLTERVSAATSTSAMKVSYSNSTIDNLTKALILIPIAAGLSGIAFLIALFSHRIGYLFASFVAAIAFLVALVAMAINFAIFGSIKSTVNGNGSGSYATYGAGTWVLLAAFIILFFASITTCFACVTERRTSKHNRRNIDNDNFNNKTINEGGNNYDNGHFNNGAAGAPYTNNVATTTPYTTNHAVGSTPYASHGVVGGNGNTLMSDNHHGAGDYSTANPQILNSNTNHMHGGVGSGMTKNY